MYDLPPECRDRGRIVDMTWLKRLLWTGSVSTGLSGSPFEPTHRHRKGGQYRLLARGILEADRSPVAIYDDAEGTVWVRSLEEFEDGRFSPI